MLQERLAEESKQKLVYLECYQRESEQMKVKDLECDRLRAEISTLSYEMEMKQRENESLQRDMEMIRREEREARSINEQLQVQLNHREQEYVETIQRLNSLQRKQHALCEIREYGTQTEQVSTCNVVCIQTLMCESGCENYSQTEEKEVGQAQTQTHRQECRDRDMQTEDGTVSDCHIRDACMDRIPFAWAELGAPGEVEGLEEREDLKAKIVQHVEEIESLKLQVNALRLDLDSKRREVM